MKTRNLHLTAILTLLILAAVPAFGWFGISTSSPANVTVEVGETFSVAINTTVQYNPDPTVGYQIPLVFDPSIVQAVSITGGSAPFVSNVLTSTFDNSAGTANFHASGSGVNAGGYHLFTIEFEAIASGTFQLLATNTNQYFQNYGVFGNQGGNNIATAVEVEAGDPPPTSLGISGWEMNRGGGYIYLNGTTLAYHGDPAVYAWANIPAADDSNWGAAPNTETIGFSERSYLPGVLTYADFTYFQTFLSIPENTQINACYVDFRNADDGAQITIFNSDYPAGYSPAGANIRLGGPGQTADISDWIADGEVNRVVITQVDNQATGNNLAYAAIVLNGTPILLNNAPTADAGEDQSEDCAPAGHSFTLDGSGSSDPDGDELSYSWTYGGTEVATSASFDVSTIGNLLTNGSFEDGTPGSGPPLPGWTDSGVSGYGGNSIDWGDWSGAANDGAWVIDLVGTGTPAQGMQPGSVEQVLDTEPGGGYVLTFDMKTNGSPSLLVTIDGNTQTFTSGGSFTSHSVAFTASSAATTIRLAADASWHYLYNNLFLDNVSVTLGGGSHTFELTVSDGELTDNDEVTLAVNEDTEAPVISTPENLTVSNDEGVCGAEVSFDISASDACGVASLVAVPASGSVFNLGTTTVTVTATDDAGNSSSSSFTVTVEDKEAPVIAAIENITASNDPGECGAVVNFALSAEDNCELASVVSNPTSGSFFAVGTTEVTVTATDAAGNTSESTFDVTVEDKEAPIFTAELTPAVMWPPNHKYRSFSVADFIVSLDDNCSDLSAADVIVTSVTSDEPEDVQSKGKGKGKDDGNGDGNTLNDMVINGGSVDLRAERQGGGNGRVYTVYLAVQDEHGNSSTASFQVSVPHNKKDTAVDDGAVYTVTGSSLTKRLLPADQTAEAYIPESFGLKQNYPNPFNPSTSIGFDIAESGLVQLNVYDIRGSLVSQLVSGYQLAGSHQVHFDASSLSAGIYLYVLQVNGERFVKRMSLIK